MPMPTATLGLCEKDVGLGEKWKEKKRETGLSCRRILKRKTQQLKAKRRKNKNEREEREGGA
jgi:hypothetical protein